jgi:hypothetical protein
MVHVLPLVEADGRGLMNSMLQNVLRACRKDGRHQSMCLMMVLAPGGT